MLKVTVSGNTGEGKTSLVEHIRIALVKVGYSITTERGGEPGITSVYPRGSKQEVRIIEEFSEEEIDQVVRYAEVYFNKKELSNIEIIEAKLTRIMTDILKVQCAHAPVGHTLDNFNEIVDPRIAAEMVSVTYAFCCLKGLHKAPEITDGREGITVKDIDALVSPSHCFGIPHKACIENEIPIITVMENEPIVKNNVKFESFKVSNYMEAAGLILAMKEGISFSSLRRPLKETELIT